VRTPRRQLHPVKRQAFHTAQIPSKIMTLTAITPTSAKHARRLSDPKVLAKRWSPTALPTDRSRGRPQFVVRGGSLGRLLVQRTALDLFRCDQEGPGEFERLCPVWFPRIRPGRRPTGAGLGVVSLRFSQTQKENRAAVHTSSGLANLVWRRRRAPLGPSDDRHLPDRARELYQIR